LNVDPFREGRFVGQVRSERVEAQACFLHVRPVAVDAISLDKRLDLGVKRRILVQTPTHRRAREGRARKTHVVSL